MQLTEIKYKKNLQGFVIIQTVYAFIMALGLREIFLAVPNFWEGAALYETRFWSVDYLLIGLSLLAIILIGIRFFWVPRNLREIVSVFAKTHLDSTKTQDDLSPEESIHGIVFPVHILTILLHAALFFHICSEFRRVLDIYASVNAIQFSDFRTVLFGYVFLLLLNGAWLAFIENQINQRYTQTDVSMPSGLKPVSLWWKNNLIAGVAALSLFAMYSSCGGAGLTCLESNPGFAYFGWSATPGGPESWAAPAQWLESVISPPEMDWVVLFAIILIFIINSGFDLWQAGAAYMIFEDVEWTRPAHSAEAIEDHAEPATPVAPVSRDEDG